MRVLTFTGLLLLALTGSAVAQGVPSTLGGGPGQGNPPTAPIINQGIHPGPVSSGIHPR
jgi:hypothetical protein